MKIPMFGLLAACVLGGIVQAQVVTDTARPTDKEIGENCYYGRCDQNPGWPGGGGGPGVELPSNRTLSTSEKKCKDCSKLTSSALLCYTCCENNGCTASPLTWCQDMCISLGSPWAGWPTLDDQARDEMINAIPSVISGMAHAIERGERLNQADLDWIDGALAITYRSGDTNNARWLLALILEAFDQDAIDADDPDKLWTMVGEIHRFALMDSGDARFRRTGLAVLAQKGLQGRVDDRGEIFVSLIVEAASQPEGKADALLLDAIRNF